MEVLAGQRDATAGGIAVHGEPYHARRGEMRRHKCHCLPEEPLRNTCVAAHERGREHGVAPLRSAALRDGSLAEQAAFRRAAEDLIARYRVKTPSPDAPIATLSGGNVQRAVLARELSDEVEVLIAANPCFGLDFAAAAEIHAQIIAARNRGAAVLLVSEDLDEVFELSDRIVVMFHGEVRLRDAGRRGGYADHRPPHGWPLTCGAGALEHRSSLRN